MNVFIVHAHPEPQSFNGAMTRAAVQSLTSAGHSVVVSDLYAMKFDPVSDRRNFLEVADRDYYKQQAEEKHAHLTNSFAPDIQREMDKLFACDALIFQFPLWWFSVPAILKGWVDRVFAAHRVYGGGKWYSHGTFVGKRAMCSVTLGGSLDIYAPDGLNGDLHEQVLFHINHGMFAFTGFTAVKPFVVPGPARMTHEERTRVLEHYAQTVLALNSLPTYDYPPLEAFDSSTHRRTRHQSS